MIMSVAHDNIISSTIETINFSQIMTDKHLKENSLLTGQVIHVDFISINIFFIEITAF